MKRSSLNFLTAAFCTCLCVGSISASNQNGSDSKTAVVPAEPVPVAIENDIAKLEPSNTKIEFIGNHVGDDPKPRLGGFAKFEGAIEVEGGSVNSIKVKIDINSIWTEFSKLTGHLKNKDFFLVDEHDSANFESTKIEAKDDGILKVTGNMTLMGNTKEITFPAEAKITDDGLVLVSEFELDRTLFGMDKMTSGVEKMVSIMVVVGEKTAAKAAMDGNGSKKKRSKKSKNETTEEVHVVSLKLPNMV